MPTPTLPILGPTDLGRSGLGFENVLGNGIADHVGFKKADGRVHAAAQEIEGQVFGLADQDKGLIDVDGGVKEYLGRGQSKIAVRNRLTIFGLAVGV